MSALGHYEVDIKHNLKEKNHYRVIMGDIPSIKETKEDNGNKHFPSIHFFSRGKSFSSYFTL